MRIELAGMVLLFRFFEQQKCKATWK